MRQIARYQLWIMAAAAVVFFTNLGSTALFDMDEALYTTCAREMLGRGNWVVPWFNGQMFPEKPPLMFWTMMGGFELFGVNEWGARFFSAVMGVGTALAAFHLGRLLFNSRVGLWAGLITASTIIFTVSARAATVDSALTFVTTLAMLCFVLGYQKSRQNGMERGVRVGKAAGHELSPLLSPLSPLYAAAMYACIGLAALAKGPVGVLLPVAAMGLFLLLTRGWRNVLRSAWWMRPFTAMVVVAAVAMPWYVWVGLETQWEWPRKFFVEFNLRPFKQPILGHGDVSSFHRVMAGLVSMLYYFYQIPAILCGFFPWAVFLVPTLIETSRCIRRRDDRGAGTSAPSSDPIWREGCILATCWFGVWFVFWSVCKTKLPHYLLPAYPALALLTACFVERWLGEPASLRSWMLRNAWISMIVVGIGFIVAIPIVATIYLPGEQWLGLIGLVLVLGGGWCSRATARGRHSQAAVGMAVTSVVFLTAMFGFAALRVDRHQNAKPMIAAIRADYGRQGPLPIATYRFFRESAVYYAGNPVTKCDEQQDGLARFLAQSRPAYVITTSEYEPEIMAAFPDKFQTIFQQRRFLGPGDMVVLRSTSRD